MGLIVYLNGEFVPYEKALIPIEDRGNVYADGIYEVVRFYGGKPLELNSHFERLAKSAAAIRLELPPLSSLIDAALETARRNRENEADSIHQNLYIQVTRGVAPRKHPFPAEAKPTVFMIARSAPRPERELLENGAAAITVPDIRWHRCDIKSLCLLPNVLAKQQAVEAGAYEAIFIRDGVVTEGSSSNLFMVKDGALWTHPSDHYVLPGITHRVVVRLAEKENIPVHFATFLVSQLMAADEIFITSTTSEIMPITRLDGKPVNDGRPGPITRRLQKGFDALVERVMKEA
ncbi:MAG TPA: D-amino-acid transaminase [Firmicutes bacterium]|nr:D-amino-acid transaminase [Bacillota bacterium]